MKLFGLSGLATGKKGDAVFSINAGTQIVRQWNPAVSNPKTPAQVESRAKLKLMSQLGSAVKPFIAIAKDGMKTPRNQFISKNYDLVTYANNEAQIALEDMQFTKGAIALPSFTATRENDKLKFALDQDMAASLDRVVYLVVSCPSNQEVIPAASIVAQAAGADGDFKAEIDNVAGDICVYAYGIRDNDAASRVKFSDLGVDPGITVAKIVATRTLSSTSYSMTETRGLQLSSGESSGGSTGTNAVRISVTPVNGGDTMAGITGAGNYQVGDTVTLVSPKGLGEGFNGWYDAASNGTQLSSNVTYSFTASESKTIYYNYEEGSLG